MTKNPNPSSIRWTSSDGTSTLIKKMDDDYLLNAIWWCIRQKGHKHRRLNALVVEAYNRGLPLPRHKWVIVPTYPVEVSARYCDAVGYNPALRD
jgi:hypothetical protein